MDLPKQIIDTLNSVKVDESLNKDDKTSANDHLKFLEKIVDNNTEKKNLNMIIEVLNKGRLTIADKETIIELKPKIEAIVNKYVEEFNIEPNTDAIDKTLNEDEIELILDGKINKYQFNKKHPMDYVSYDIRDKNYKVSIGKNYHIKKIYDACKTAKKFIITEKSPKKTVDFPEKIKFDYQGHYILSYWINNNPYFDIQHIISILNLKTAHWNEKYNYFSEYITYHVWHQNQFGGYILRELISEEGMFQIILSSNSVVSKSFKKDVSKILVGLRKSGNLIITSEHIQLTNNVLKSTSAIKEYDYRILSYSNHNDISNVQTYVDYASNINIAEYANTPVMYLFIIFLPTNHTYFLAKIGYTDNIVTRIKTLKYEYKAKNCLLNLKRVISQTTERQFHDLVKIAYPKLPEHYKIKSADGKKTTDKDEIYKFTSKLYDEFNAIKNLPSNGKVNEIDSDIESFMSEQSILFFEFVQNRMKIVDFIDNHNHNDPVKIAYIDKNFNYLIEREKYHLKKEIKKEWAVIEIEKIKLEKEKMKFEKYKLEHSHRALTPDQERVLDKQIKLAKLLLQLTSNKKLSFEQDYQLEEIQKQFKKYTKRPVIKL